MVLAAMHQALGPGHGARPAASPSIRAPEVTISDSWPGRGNGSGGVGLGWWAPRLQGPCYGSSRSHMRGSRAHTRPGISEQPTWAEKSSFFGTSLVVRWIRLHPPNAGGTGSISSWELRGQVPSDADKQ